MKNQPQISMTITGLMLKSYMIVARTWATGSKATREAKQMVNTISHTFRSLPAAQA